MSGQSAKLAQKMQSIGVTLCKPIIWFASWIGSFFLGRFMGIAGIFANPLGHSLFGRASQ